MLTITPEPLTKEAFAPYGDVLEAPVEKGRLYYEEALGNGRPDAWPSLFLSCALPVADLPLDATIMERHEFSSQTFVPLAPTRWVVMVAPHAADGGPDMRRARAFLPAPGQGITYRMNVWHHPNTVFGARAQFAVFMWRDGGKGDEEFFTLPEPVRIAG